MNLTVNKLILHYLMVYTAVHLQTLPASTNAQFNILCTVVLLFFHTFRRIRYPQGAYTIVVKTYGS
jgi:hypothetical protein